MPDTTATPGSDQGSPGLLERLRNRYEGYKVKALDRLEEERGRRPSVRVAFDFYRRDQAFAGSLLAGGLSVKLFLWFLPFALSFVALFGTVAERFDRPADDVARDSGLTAVLAGMIGEAVEASSRARWYLAGLGLVLLLWAGLGVVRALALTSRLAWRMEKPPPMRKMYGSLAVIGFVVAILGVQWARNQFLGRPWYVDLLVLGLAIVCVTGMHLLIFELLPHPGDVPWTALLPGALLMTTGLLVIRLATLVYFAPRLESAPDLYGGLGLAGVFLAWLYIISRLLVASVSLNATIWQRDQAGDQTAGAIG
ncbi:MAG TPA: YhjD/YihY/BrkB family envelope integrity protein [Acidimicrobiia bacterium]|nr:YhjD/YihY/BrkB family envelope integrity protein [Acidimicrobiia bacterium]